MNETFPQVRNARSLFPQPEDGAVVEVTPPPLCWLAVDGVHEYRVVIENAAGKAVVDATVDKNVFVGREPLPPGKYRWDVCAGARRRGWQSFTVANDAVKRIVPTAQKILSKVPAAHPRLMYLPGDTKSLIETHAHKIPTLKRNIETALKEGIVPRPHFHRNDMHISGALDNRRSINRHRVFIDRNLVSCALGYVLLGDKQAGQFARASMMEICDWNPDGPLSVDGPWGDEPALSHARCMPLVYDWTYDLYSQKEHYYIQQTLATMGRHINRLLKHENFLSNPGSSHAGRMPAYLGNIALALHGHTPEADSAAWLQFALDIYGSFFPHYGTRDGGWAEGTFYGTSYTKWYQPFFFAVERLTGFSFFESPFYWRVSQFFLHFSPPGWEIHPFCDGYWSLPDSEEWPGFYAQDPFGVYAQRFGPPLARDFAKKLGTPELFKLHLLDAFPPAYKPQRPEAAGPAENARNFPDTGFASIHSDIAHPDDDTALLIRASKFGAGSHRHSDQGAFAIMSRGKGLLTPTGYFGYTYGTKHHYDWTFATQAHNCVLINGRGQPVREHTTVGSIVHFENNERFGAVRADLKGAYPDVSSYIRTYLFVRPGLILVHDRIDTPKPASFSWLAHGLSKPAERGGVVSIERAPAALKMTLLHPDQAPKYSITDRCAVDLNEGIAPENHVTFPTQYHMRWDAPEGAAGRFMAAIAVNGELPNIRRDGAKALMQYEGVAVSMDLQTGEFRVG